ncbi:MAG: hypothetical protein Q8930_12790 [Bacillota bacterium]|nr:hypothetical protein [Bacillota bacterium]
MKKFAVIITLILIFVMKSTVSACTVFNASDGSKILAATNEDGLNTNARAWFLPPGKDEYGAVFFGFDDTWVQGGINDQGLFIDWAEEDSEEINFPEEGVYYKGNYSILYEGNLNEKILQSCANLQEALDMYKKFNEIAFYHAHVMIADKTGASAIIEPYKGELKVLKKEAGNQYMSNFNISESKEPDYVPNNVNMRFSRYYALERGFEANSQVTADNFRTLLESASDPETIYSNIYDLNSGDIYIYYMRDYSKPVKFNLKEELAKGKHMYELSALFNKDVPNLSKTNVNNLNPFSEKAAWVQQHLIFCMIVFIFWPVVLALRFAVSRKRSGKGISFRLTRGEVMALLISLLSAVMYFIHLKSLIKYGFYLRYGFKLYQEILLYIPPVIIAFSLMQLIFAVYSWKKGRWPLFQRILYSVVTVCFVYISISMQHWCWHLF